MCSGVVWCIMTASYMWIEVRTMCMRPHRLLAVVRCLDSVYVRYVRITRNIMQFKAFSFLLLAITPPCMFDVVYRLNLAYLGIHPARCHTPTPPRYASSAPSPPISKIFLFLFFFCTSPCTLRFDLSRFSFVLSEFCVSCGKL